MDYIGTNSQGTANAPNGMSDQLLGAWFQPGFPFLGAGHCAILPWPHVRNQEKRFAREHFAFAREEKRFAREHFTFAREQKRFPRCRRTAVVFRRSLHPPADAASGEGVTEVTPLISSIVGTAS